MALIFAGMKCPICQLPLGSEDLFTTWGVFLPADDVLCGFCDTGMHWRCYESWPNRMRFARAYFDFWIEHEKSNPYWGAAYCDDLILVTVNPLQSINSVSIRLSSTGRDVRIPLSSWNDWLNNRCTEQCLHRLEKESLETAIPLLKERLPDANTVLASVDWHAKRKLAQNELERKAQVEALRLSNVAVHNLACGELERQRKNSGLACHNCHQHSSDFRYMNNAPNRKSYFICNKCAHTVEPN